VKHGKTAEANVCQNDVHVALQNVSKIQGYTKHSAWSESRGRFIPGNGKNWAVVISSKHIVKQHHLRDIPHIDY